MKELRCIVFNQDEIILALRNQRKRRGDTFPAGDITRIAIKPTRPVSVTVHIKAEEGAEESPFTFEQTEIAAALIAHCIERKVPLPFKAKKFITVYGGEITLMVTMNFQDDPAQMGALS
ncbi:MAG: hypothetical protein U9N14_02890 [Pseudomonadota bacterium]|nr:hypothetical protein [Pseudomonadota bacterium]